MRPPGCNPACPACAHIGWSAARSERQKSAWLARRLAPWGARLAPLRGPGEGQRLGYRDRIALRAKWCDGRWQFGVMRRDDFIPIPDCSVHSPRVRESMALLGRALPGAAEFALAYLVISGAQLVLVLKQRSPPPALERLAALGEALAALGIDGVWLHCFPAAGRNLFTKRGWHRLRGEPRSRDAQGFVYGPGAFAQLLPDLHHRSLDQAQAFLDVGVGDRVADLYCGRGLSLRRWLDAGAEALGVELAAEALACAAQNAPGATLLRGGCAQRLAQLAPWLGALQPARRFVYLNPPRTGLEPEVGAWLAADARPQRIAYLSCSAGTLARDLGLLCAAGYRVVSITPYDFFPQTCHVETLALLTR